MAFSTHARGPAGVAAGAPSIAFGAASVMLVPLAKISLCEGLESGNPSDRLPRQRHLIGTQRSTGRNRRFSSGVPSPVRLATNLPKANKNPSSHEVLSTQILLLPVSPGRAGALTLRGMATGWEALSILTRRMRRWSTKSRMYRRVECPPPDGTKADDLRGLGSRESGVKGCWIGFMMHSLTFAAHFSPFGIGRPSGP
jgi:hypothetical protein